MKKILNTSGTIQTLPLLLVIAAIGIISFLLITSTAPVGGLFGVLSPKLKSNAATPMPSDMMMMTDSCLFSNGQSAAFCDTFDTPMPGGRGGDLDETKWSMFRTSDSLNFLISTAQFCTQVKPGITPDNDSFICGEQFGEPNHWMTSVNDGSHYVTLGARALQPFDFTNRTGTVVVDVDAKTQGSHTWWPEIWITDQPIPNAHHAANSNIMVPKNGIGLELGGAACSSQAPGIGNDLSDTTSKGLGGIEFLEVDRNYVTKDYNGGTGLGVDPNDCYVTQADHANHFEIRLSQNRIEVWVSDATPMHGQIGPNFRRRYYLDNLNLPFTRGYVSLEHSHYNGCKDAETGAIPGKDCTANQTYHWHGAGFDGPILPVERSYQVPDPLKPTIDLANAPAVTYTYPLTTTGPSFTLQNVDLTNAASAQVALTYNFGEGPFSFQYRVNGKTWHTFNAPAPQPIGGGATGWFYALTDPLPLNELVQGTNTLEFKSVTANIPIANIDLLVEPVVPTILQTPTPAPATPTPTPFVSPTPGTNSFTGEYWNSGTGAAPVMPTTQPDLIRNDTVINFDWGQGSPDPMISNDRFIARWTGNFSFNAGNYTFSTTADDGVRVYIDGTLVIDHWVDEGPTTYTLSKTMTSGMHAIKMEYYEDTVGATAKLNWTQSSGSSSTPSSSPSCSKASLGDIDCDGTIGIFDFNGLIGNFGKTEPSNTNGDLDGNGKVDIFDFNILIGNFGK